MEFTYRVETSICEETEYEKLEGVILKDVVLTFVEYTFDSY